MLYRNTRLIAGEEMSVSVPCLFGSVADCLGRARICSDLSNHWPLAAACLTVSCSDRVVLIRTCDIFGFCMECRPSDRFVLCFIL